MIKNLFKNMNIYKKILTAFLGVLSVVGIFMLITCFLIIFKIKNYSLKEISGLSSEVFEIGGSSLKEQSKNNLKNISSSLSKNVQNSLNNISHKVLISCESIEKIIQSQSNFKGFIPPLPENTVVSEDGKGSSKAYVVDSDSNSNDPLVYFIDSYQNNDINKVKTNFWKSISESERKKILSSSSVVSENIIPKNLYQQLLLISNCEYIFQPIFNNNDCISCIYIGTESGIYYKYSNDNSSERYDPRERSWYIDAVKMAEKSNDPVWQNVYISKSTEKFCITCSKAFKNKNGKILGVCAVDMYIDDISDLILKYKIGESGYNFIIDQNGNIVMHPEYASIFKDENSFKNFNLSESEFVNEILNKKRDVISAKIDNKNYYFSFLPMEINEWTWVSAISEDELMQPIYKIENLIDASLEKSKKSLEKDFNFIIIVFLIVFSISFIIIYFVCTKLSKNFSSPIIRLCEATKSIGRGNFDLSVDKNSNDEIGELAKSFNSMARNLKRYMKNLKKTTAEKEKVHSELMIANRIQKSMLPCIFPAFPGRNDFDIYAVMNPAREVGGDFYDFFFIDENRLALVIADVSDKGVSAALFMVVAKILIKNQLQNGDFPAEVLKIVNNRLCENNEVGMFVTCFLGIFDIKSGKFTYANAGHNPPFLYRKSEENCTIITSPHGLVLGGTPNISYLQSETYLYPGDFLFLYTDGVTEAANKKGRLFSQQKLEEIVNSCGKKNVTIQDLIFDIKSEINNFIGKTAVSDDITMLALKNFTVEPSENEK